MRPTVFERELEGIAASDRAMQQNDEAGLHEWPVVEPKETIKRGAFRAQAMVEFALALPIFLLVVYGLLEVGRLVFMYAAVTTASREAVRYASGWGYVDSLGIHQQYQYCTGIRNAARQVGFLLNLSGTSNSNIHIYLDDETPAQAITPPSLFEYCTTSGADFSTSVGPFTTHPVNTGDRVVVRVTATYTPILPLFLPLTTQTISSTTSRTLTGILDLSP